MPSTVNLTLTPIAMQGVPAPGYGAVDIRRYLGLGFREGVMSTADLAVTQRAGGPGMAVDVAVGYGLVQGDAVALQGLYHVVSDTALTGANELTISAAHATLPRVDSIILDVQDNAYDGSGFNRARVRVLTGTPSAGANRTNRTGAVALPQTALLLADVEVAANATTISNANIQDRRPLALLQHDIGEVFFIAGTTAPPGAKLANGGTLNRVHYADLYNAILTAHGAGDGSTTFGIPNLAGRSPVGVGTSSAAGATAHTLGQLGGEETHRLLAAESGVNGNGSTSGVGAHNHAGVTTGMDRSIDHLHGYSRITTVVHQVLTGSSGNFCPRNFYDGVATGAADRSLDHLHAVYSDGAHSHALSARDSDQAHNNMHPYTGLTACVYHGMAF